MSAVGLLILAAGGSRRLGTPKQLLRDADGESLIRRAARTALASQCRPAAVVLGASADAVQGEFGDLPLMTVHNPHWETGMASSLRMGLATLLEAAPLEAVVVMLCDQPLVTPALLDSLVTAHQASDSEIVACEYDGIVGVPALFSQKMFESLNELRGDEGARRVIKAYPGPITRVAFPGGRLDIDTQGDLVTGFSPYTAFPA